MAEIQKHKHLYWQGLVFGEVVWRGRADETGKEERLRIFISRISKKNSPQPLSLGRTGGFLGGRRRQPYPQSRSLRRMSPWSCRQTLVFSYAALGDTL